MSNLVINSVEIGKRIKSLRMKMNKTQNYFADILYISPSYLALIEAGKRTPNPEILVQLSKVTGASIDYILTGKTDDTTNPEQRTFDKLSMTYKPHEIRQALKLAEFFLKMTHDETD